MCWRVPLPGSADERVSNVRSICMATATTAVLAVLPLSCSRSVPVQSAAVQQGHALYVSNCSPCHDADNVVLRKRPPSLTGIFQRANFAQRGDSKRP